ncbi:MAG: hypothetical protein F4Z29_11585 [Gemmatimonadetes bacterium]|nr:hypothetical protein [Gemmatimonadota bacterium]
MRFLVFVFVVLIYGCSGEHSPVATVEIPIERVRLTAHQTSDEPLYEVYDFRWNNWNDTKAKVTESEPGEIRFELAEGSGLSALENGYTTDVFTFANGEKDTIDVEYDFAGDELYAGHYWFDETMNTVRTQMLIDELDVRYGDPVSETTGRITWMKNGDTEVYITLSDDGSGGCLHYYSPDADEKVEKAKSYNDLPIRVVVPE